jgi:hypothetical protein
MSLLRTIRPVDPVRIELTRVHASNPAVPHVASAVACRAQLDYPGRYPILRAIKELEPDTSGVPAKERKIDAIPLLVSSQG